MVRIGFSIVIFSFFCSCSKTAYYLFRANRALENIKTDKAEYWYRKALQIDSSHFRANCEYGLMLGEWMNLHEKALPYLERAFQKMPKDTNWNLMHGLVKAYQHQEQYKKALYILSFMKDMKTWDGEDKEELIRDLEKRKSDCEWALQHSSDTTSPFTAVNLGGKINTPLPEYVPLLASNGDLLFTSKRKDADREKFSLLDGKYHEAVYVAQPSNGNTSRYVIPEKNSKKLKRNSYHESLVSFSNNKKIYFYFKKGQLYEVHADSLLTNEPRKLNRSVNFEFYHNHAFLTSDGKMLFFTSDAEGGEGGLDIYVSEKQSDGTWGKARNLGKEINTPFDEDAPYYDEKNKVLYFSSKGHPGFGFYDVFAAQHSDGKFLPPINMGKAINSGGNDIFYSLTPYDFALHSSSRKGGFGDMDIYKIWNVSDWSKKPCNPVNLKYAEKRVNGSQSLIELDIPFSIQHYIWLTEGKILEQAPGRIIVEWEANKPRKLSWKGLTLSDTARYLMPLCVDISLPYDEMVSTTPAPLPKDEEPEADNEWISGEKASELTGISPLKIYFSFDSYKLQPEEKEKLKQLAKWLTQNAYQISICAFSDDRGTDSYNLVLSEKRAEAIKVYLMKQGVPSTDIIEVKGKGRYPDVKSRYADQRVGKFNFRKKNR